MDAGWFDLLKRTLRYDADTGIFTRLITATGKGNGIGTIAGGDKGNGYLRIRIGGHRIPAHRLAWLYVTGAWPSGELDHINGNRGDNRFCNLREVSRAENMQNRHSAMKNNKSTGILGVYKDHGRFKAMIWAGKAVYLGTYATPETAQAAYLKAKHRLHPGLAHGTY